MKRGSRGSTYFGDRVSLSDIDLLRQGWFQLFFGWYGVEDDLGGVERL